MTDHQHFVTQAVLRNFSSSKKKDKIFAILHTNNKLQIKSNHPINRIFEQNRYFTTSAGHYDSWFTAIDSQAPPIIASIIENGVGKLNLQEREKINEFIALQWLRCVGIRNSILNSKILEDHKKEYLEFKQEIRDLDKQKKISLDDLKNDPRWSDVNYLDKMLGEDYIKNTHAGLFTDIQFLIQKLSDLTLSSVSPKSLNKESEYVISGSPVLYNVWEPEFYFPISPTNCLRFHSNNSSLSPLDSRFINELQFINGEGYNGFRVAARYRETLEYLENTPLKYDEIQNLENSFWKCLFLEMYKKNQATKKVSG